MTAGSPPKDIAADLDPSALLVRSPEVLWRQAGRVVLARTVSDPEVVELFGTGVLLWLALVEPITVAELAVELAAAVDVPVEVVATDVRAAVADLLRRGLVTRVQGPA
jgi:coenzyme PQQ synthesis protein D (PqqD)